MTRKLTVQEDATGPFIKFRVFGKHWLIVRPGAPGCFGGHGATFVKGDKVMASTWNYNMGFFMIKKPGDPSQRCIWHGPRWVTEGFKGEWVGEQIKKS